MKQPLVKFRSGQAEFFWATVGLLALLARRQYGKSFMLGNWALKRMVRNRGRLVVFASASVRLGTENIRKEAEIWRDVMAKAKADHPDGKIKTSVDDDGGNLLDLDAICERFESQKLETRLYHDHSTFSRSIVVAPNPDTAVGWTGDVILDEVGRMPEFKDVLEAMEPIVSSNPDFNVRMATTPPPDDNHYSWELLAPPPGAEFEANPKGNWYTSGLGIRTLRIDADDAAADGIPLYDLKTREALTPAESRARAIDKNAWDRNYGLKFLAGGTAALSLNEINNAMTLGEELGCVGHNLTDTLAA